jgi:hypothetical protein
LDYSPNNFLAFAQVERALGILLESIGLPLFLLSGLGVPHGSALSLQRR